MDANAPYMLPRGGRYADNGGPDPYYRAPAPYSRPAPYGGQYPGAYAYREEPGAGNYGAPGEPQGQPYQAQPALSEPALSRGSSIRAKRIKAGRIAEAPIPAIRGTGAATRIPGRRASLMTPSATPMAQAMAAATPKVRRASGLTTIAMAANAGSYYAAPRPPY